jgi:hypothetical protein
MIVIRSQASSIINAVAYQIGWFACVLGAAADRELLGALVAISLALIHLALCEQPKPEWKLMMAAGTIGACLESLNASLGILEFAGHEPGTLAPVWILALWIQFATVFHFCMGWLSRRYLLAAFLGMGGGPLAFLGGERLGAATIGEPRAFSLAFLAFSWMLLLPALVRIADRFGGVGSYRALPWPWRSMRATSARFGRGI